MAYRVLRLELRTVRCDIRRRANDYSLTCNFLDLSSLIDI